MNVPKLHHYLAEAYLKRFTDENGDLWVLDRRTADIRRQRPEVTAAERELYTLDLHEAPDRSVETLLAETVDGPGLRVIGAIAGGRELEEADRAPLAAFVAGLLLRTPSFREQHRQFGEQMRGALRRWGVEPLEMAPEWLLAPQLADLRTKEWPAADRPFETCRTRVLLNGVADSNRDAPRTWENVTIVRLRT